MCPTEPSSQPTGQPSVVPSRQPSGQPSGQPTTMPTCDEGSKLLWDPEDEGKQIDYTIWQNQSIWAFINHTRLDKVRKLARKNLCQLCPPGFYSNEKDSPICHPAPRGYYVPRAGMTEPLSCDPFYPYYSAVEGQTWCSGVYINISPRNFWIVSGVYFGIFFCLLLLASENFLAVFFFNIFPALDLISDIQYILSTPFYSQPLFYSCVVFIFLPSLSFISVLSEKGAPMCLFKVLDFTGLSYDSLEKKMLEVMKGDFSGENSIWKFCQAIMTSLWVLICVIGYSPVYVLGAFCYQSKVIAIKAVWDKWIFLWTCSSNYAMEDLQVDTAILNESLFSEFMFETLPQLTIQSLNSNATGLFGPVQIFSTCLSAYITVNGLYTFGYYMGFEGKSWNNIPTKTALLFFLDFELETNEEVINRQDLVSYYERIITRGIRVRKLEKKGGIQR